MSVLVLSTILTVSSGSSFPRNPLDTKRGIPGNTVLGVMAQQQDSLFSVLSWREEEKKKVSTGNLREQSGDEWRARLHLLSGA